MREKDKLCSSRAETLSVDEEHETTTQVERRRGGSTTLEKKN